MAVAFTATAAVAFTVASIFVVIVSIVTPSCGLAAVSGKKEMFVSLEFLWNSRPGDGNVHIVSPGKKISETARLRGETFPVAEQSSFTYRVDNNNVPTVRVISEFVRLSRKKPDKTPVSCRNTGFWPGKRQFSLRITACLVKVLRSLPEGRKCSRNGGMIRIPAGKESPDMHKSCLIRRVGNGLAICLTVGID
ncbi:hypothetical protein [Rubinisphaera margarita]|uniref:hypothetical protein n=1 Tax=Rubinisphaera margarita TaxID=2909586 RepID=UPI001EE826F3|nr:hypothetical protein [Rubinisphaera margarita]MCG6156748.1 hypothetical protein [Rubinisphaera margarita]